MRTQAGTADSDVAVDEQFFAPLCSDDDLLRAEFDTMGAAEWPIPPARTPGRGAADGRPAGDISRRTIARGAGPAARPRHPEVRGWYRQRSPPGPAADTDDRKAGDRHT
jgi:hypothetical protein